MYTELVMNVSLKDDMPEGVAKLLKAMIDGSDNIEPLAEYAEHQLFATSRWRFMLNTGSFYFVPAGASKLVEHNYGRILRHLTIRTDFKNYENEIEKFADFIGPFIDDYGHRQFAGYSRYEEADDPKKFIAFWCLQNKADLNALIAAKRSRKRQELCVALKAAFPSISAFRSSRTTALATVPVICFIAVVQ